MKLYRYTIKDMMKNIVFQTQWTNELIIPASGTHKFVYELPKAQFFLKYYDNDGEACEIVKVEMKEVEL